MCDPKPYTYNQRVMASLIGSGYIDHAIRASKEVTLSYPKFLKKILKEDMAADDQAAMAGGRAADQGE